MSFSTGFFRLPVLFLCATLALGAGAFGSGCMSAYKKTMGGETSKVFSRIYLTDYNTAWQAVLESLKSYRLDVSNREGGYLQTKWQENTADKNFIDSFGNADAYLKAQMRYRISVGKGFYNGEPSVKIIVRKEQLVKMDVLEGWRPVETDALEEQTLLYRIGRIVRIKTRIAKLEKRRVELEMQKVNAEMPGGDELGEGGADFEDADLNSESPADEADLEIEKPDESLEDFGDLDELD